MSRKQYEMIAETLRRQMPTVSGTAKWGQWAHDCIALATSFANDNPRFDRARFLSACGMESL